MTLNRVKLGCPVTFMKYFASVVYLILLLENLTWNKTTFLVSNLLNLSELLVNELVRSISKKRFIEEYADSIDLY